MAESVRTKLERMLGEMAEIVEVDLHARSGTLIKFSRTLTEALAELSEMERDHEAMEVLRQAKDTSEYGWRWSERGMLTWGYPEGPRDPADAILGSKENGE